MRVFEGNVTWVRIPPPVLIYLRYSLISMTNLTPYNEDEKYFVVSNYHKMSNESLSKGLLEMGYSRTPKSIQKYLSIRGYSRTKEEISKFLKEEYTEKYLSDKEIEFIKQNYKNLNNKEISIALKKMGFKSTISSVSNAIHRLSAKRTREDLENIGGAVVYCEQELNFILENYQKLPKPLILEELETMGFSRTLYGLRKFYQKKGLVVTEQQRKEIARLHKEIKKSRLLNFYQQAK